MYISVMAAHDGEEQLQGYSPLELVDYHLEVSACHTDPGWWWPQVVSGGVTMLDWIESDITCESSHHLTE